MGRRKRAAPLNLTLGVTKMIGTSAFLLAFLIPAVWFFVRAQPKTERVAELKRYNVIVIVLAIVTVVATTVYFWATTGQSVDKGWWVALAILGSVFFVCVLLALATIFRFFFFRSRTAT